MGVRLHAVGAVLPNAHQHWGFNGLPVRLTAPNSWETRVELVNSSQLYQTSSCTYSNKHRPIGRVK
jgi:hypothetical protein